MKHAYAWPTAISDHYFCRQITTLTHYFGIMFGIIFFCGMNIFALHVAFFFGIQIDIFNILSGIYSGIRFRIPCRNLCGILCNMLFDIFWFDFDSLSGIATEIWSLRLTPGSVH